ncbi:hypothetical protein CQ14_26645 [Bradyrhizobium lablabi]|uniref:Uncharacterized protein n=1 Tax=Bradyrhizobium lablabi TaxID=722472 RepID=A0A0R3N1S3_9BRAD|nr:hypothetical protein [Bradyrhizobium lablabi]KRR26075.1 hypothetical protein CQ14_26645 [Bradyrhizobium lablabi]
MRWLTSLRRTRLARRLDSYPPYRAPFPDDHFKLSVEQAQANLDYLLAHRAERLAVLGELLAEENIDLRAGLVADDYKPLLDALHGWAKSEWPGIHDRKIASFNTRLSSTREGPEIAYSLVMDVAILLGELIVTRRPVFVWSLDLDPENGPAGSDPASFDNAMDSYKRPVVQIPKGGPFPTIILDVEAIVAYKYSAARGSVTWALNGFYHLVNDAVSGAYEEYWVAEAQRAAESGTNVPR